MVRGGYETVRSSHFFTFICTSVNSVFRDILGCEVGNIYCLSVSCLELFYLYDRSPRTEFEKKNLPCVYCFGIVVHVTFEDDFSFWCVATDSTATLCH